MACDPQHYVRRAQQGTAICVASWRRARLSTRSSVTMETERRRPPAAPAHRRLAPRYTTTRTPSVTTTSIFSSKTSTNTQFTHFLTPLIENIQF